MAYKAHVWKPGDMITEDLMNALENGVANEQVGPTGPAGKDGSDGAKGATGEPGATGVGVKSIALTTDADGKVTGGTLTTTDNKTSAITVTVAGA